MTQDAHSFWLYRGVAAVLTNILSPACRWWIFCSFSGCPTAWSIQKEISFGNINSKALLPTSGQIHTKVTTEHLQVLLLKVNISHKSCIYINKLIMYGTGFWHYSQLARTRPHPFYDTLYPPNTGCSHATAHYKCSFAHGNSQATTGIVWESARWSIWPKSMVVTILK